jgi:hypothetical protein
MLALLLVLLFSATCGAGVGPTFLGPTPYLSAADSPFNLAGPNFCLEDFENGGPDTPGVTGNGSLVDPSGITDSVDGDDGAIDGSGNGGHSYFGTGSTGITFTFDPGAPLGLPTQAGMVWTDGEGTVSFEAFAPDGTSLGVIGPFDHPDGSISGTTAEDRFYGVTNAAGISAIKLTNTSGGIEVDHLQYDHCLAPGATTTTSTTPTTSTSTETTSTTSSTTLVSTTTTSTIRATTTTASTTTTLPTGCAAVPVGPSFPSLNCRLAALLAQVTASTELGPQQTKLRQQVEKAKARKEQAEAFCRESNLRRTRKRLIQTITKLVQIGQTLRNRQARKSIPDTLREGLLGQADAIHTDLQTLRDGVRCPDDAPPAG